MRTARGRCASDIFGLFGRALRIDRSCLAGDLLRCGTIIGFVPPLLTWIFLLTAIGIALTSGRFVDFTAAHIRRASRLMRPVEPDHATKALLVQLWLAAIGFAILTLRPPPDVWIEVGRNFGAACAASIVWSGVMSIGVASFGANAHAARKAF